jgi:hypothetical protein
MESFYSQKRQARQCLRAPRYRLDFATFTKQLGECESFVGHRHSPSVML